jgi:phosphatidylglycerol:prolipoprotein diacylglycerol transferase
LSVIAIILQCLKNSSTEEQKNNLVDLLFWIFIGGIAGARLWFVILSWAHFQNNPLEAFYIWHGGQSIQGGFVGGALAGWLFYSWQKAQKKDLLNPGKIFDLVAVALPVGQAVGRWGNYFNIEAFGQPSDLPWALFVPPELRPTQYLGSQSFHPTFAYESLFLLAASGLIFYLQKNLKLREGSYFCVYIALYSVGRFFLEYLRMDSLMLGPLPAAQMICLFMFVFSLGFLFLHEKQLWPFKLKLGDSPIQS